MIAKVKYVDGREVRDRNVDFVMGGHHLIFNFIPHGEVWIENTFSKYDQHLTEVHEQVEYFCMKDDWSYENAHEFANRFEHKLRNYFRDDKDTVTKLAIFKRFHTLAASFPKIEKLAREMVKEEESEFHG